MKTQLFTEAKDFQIGDQGQSVANLQNYLDRLGYLPKGRLLTAGSLSIFTSDVVSAVRKYQRFFGLPASGVVDEATRQMMEMPRCGNTDLDDGEEAHPAGVASFVASGGKWSTNAITYRFVRGTQDLIGDAEFSLVRQAFAVWAAVTPLTFSEVSGAAPADLLISWESADHGDGSSFDGPGHTLAHAFFPPPINPSPGIAGDLHFDESETWGSGHGGGMIDLLSVAIHELGHALGLSHSNVASAIMFPTYNGIKRTLDPDDIQGIQSIYGAPGSGGGPPPPKKLSFLEQLIELIRKLFGGK